MTFHRNRRLLWAWLASLAMLFASLAPSISMAIAASGAGEGWVEV